MGIGNYLHNPTTVYSKMVYVDMPFDMDERQTDAWFNRLFKTIADATPDSMAPVDYPAHHDLHILAENAVVSVGVADNQESVAVVVRPVLDHDTDEPVFPNLYARHVDQVYQRVVNYLHARDYELSTRTSAWTSARLNPSVAGAPV